MESTRFQRLLLPIILFPSTEVARRTSMTANDDPRDWIEEFAVLVCLAMCDERVIGAVNRFAVLRRDRFVMGSGNPSERGGL